MTQPITDHAAFLSEASRAVQELSIGKEALENLKAEEKKLHKALEIEKKTVSDTINSTIKKRMEEITDSYDKEIGKAQEKLKKARSKREKAKSQGVKERIAEETAELRDSNRNLRLQMKSLFQQDGVPGFCRSGWYFCLFMTRGFSELFIMLLSVFICYLAIPWGIYLLIPEKSPYYLMGIYFAIVIISGGLYLLINNKTKVRHQEALKKGRTIRDSIKANYKKIRVITHTIKRDRDEAVYDLKKYDDEISKTEQELSEIAGKKKDALNTFERVTKNIISDEIAGNYQEKIDNLEREYARIHETVQSDEAHIQELTLYITDHYEVYIGKEFMICEKLDELADLIREGKAATVSDAQTVYRSAKES